MIGVVDDGIGNIGSIRSMLRKLGAESAAVTDAEAMERCERLILPGVGAFDTGMALLGEKGLREPLDRAVSAGKPLLGICLGMQLLGCASEEGRSSGLGYIPFECVRFQLAPPLKTPHMGWDIADVADPADPLTRGLKDEPQRYYFVHSYYAVCDDPADTLMTCEYGPVFAAAVRRGRVWGVQFHPEKSHRFGMRLLKNFVEA